MARVTTNCRYCGEVFIDPKKAEMREPDVEGKHVFRFDCPLCSSTNTVEVGLREAMLMVLSGMTSYDGPDPKELLSQGLELKQAADFRNSDDDENGTFQDAEWFRGVYKFDQLN